LANHTRFSYPDAMVVRGRNRDDDQWQDPGPANGSYCLRSRWNSR
jgi:hypothetical protein